MRDLLVFLSFDVDHDTDLCDLLAEQSVRGDSSIRIIGRSAAGGVTENWSAAARRRIREADELIVICGEHTRESERMTSELRIAQEEDKPCLFLWGRRESMCSMPVGAKRDASMYQWTPQALQEHISRTFRKSKPLVVLDHEKRP